jgi:hypothetical protein
MEAHDLVTMIVLSVTLLFLAFLTYKFTVAFREGAHALGDMAEGAVIALAKHHERRVQEERMFYTRTWTRQEAAVALAELRWQLANRLHPGDSPEAAVLGPEIRDTALALAVFTKLIPSTIEIRRRVAFLEEKVREYHGSPERRCVSPH